ncbi:hypothetical protein V9L05_01565 [Bernardetia sp. Wsw4-3y2]|uniref:hypothetical protein n=1 Tax=Bernardetia sp. Wsw4-3y2 TaxID=3127471 RepID=UPI0030D1CE7C
MNPLENIKSFMEDLKNHEIESLNPSFIEEHKSDILLTALITGMQTTIDTIINQTVSHCRTETNRLIEKEHEKMVNDKDYFEGIKEEVACRKNIDNINPDWIKKTKLG